MASISKRGSSWFVQIRRKGFRPRFKSFASHSEASRWARFEEAKIDTGLGRIAQQAQTFASVKSVIDRYAAEVSPTKKGAESEELRLAKMAKAHFADLKPLALTSSAIAEYRNHRLREVKATTVRRELGLLRRVLEVARLEWGLPLDANPVDSISLPAAKDARDRRLTPEEFSKLRQAFDKGRNKLIWPVVQLAIETGLRRGELLRLRCVDVDLQARKARIRNTKNGSDRTIPLTRAASEILQARDLSRELVFPLSGNAVRQCWRRGCIHAGIRDLRFHDLRHEAISRFFELGLSVPEVALISGHKDARMLFRYTHLIPETVRDRIDKLLQN